MTSKKKAAFSKQMFFFQLNLLFQDIYCTFDSNYFTKKYNKKQNKIGDFIVLNPILCLKYGIECKLQLIVISDKFFSVVWQFLNIFW